MADSGLRLEVRDFQDLTRWRWVLAEASGAFVADYAVRLDPADWQFEAFGGLLGYLRGHVAPDRRAADEARIVSDLGTWIGSRVLGPIGSALLSRRPAAVPVVAPPAAVAAGAGELLLRPLDLAYVGGRPLAIQDVTLVMLPGPPATRPAPAGDRLRILGLFSLPVGRNVLNLRGERQALLRLTEEIAAAGRGVDVRILQYGVTRERLRELMQEPKGWDIVHIAAHGRPGSLLLETDAGRPDYIEGEVLAGLLAPGRGRVKLVTLSACLSAADQQREVLGLPPGEDSPGGVAATGPAIGGLAADLTERLGCAVLAMRYPVADDFAIALSDKLYDLLAARGETLPRALGTALRELSRVSGPPGQAFPALSVAAPTLFGGAAVDLRLPAPALVGPLNRDPYSTKATRLPPQPERFVGRTGVMAKASAALAAASGVPGVILTGMPGGGKTACALELAYGHEHAFDRLAWYKAPDERTAASGALGDFALTLDQALEKYMPGFQMAGALVSAERLTAFLPRLTELLERNRILVTIDNAESLLTESGQWRDLRWGTVVSAMCGHSGPGRLVLTSRRAPVGVDRLRVLPVGALSADEALLLIRELPHLQALGQGKIAGLDRLTCLRLARRAIESARGHPKLLELADGQAADPRRLAALLAAGDRAWLSHGGLPQGFFTDSAPAATSADYERVLATWTSSVASNLPADERDLFGFLCCLEEQDRTEAVLAANWAGLYQRLEHDGAPPALDRALAAISESALVSIRDRDTGRESYALHPAIAEAGRGDTGQAFRDAVDAEVAGYWIAVRQQTSGRQDIVKADSPLAVHAGLAAVPYLIRQQNWSHAAYLLDSAFNQDPSRACAAIVLPALKRIAGHEPSATRMMARVLTVTDPAAAEAALRDAMAEAVSGADYRGASAIAASLIGLCMTRGTLSTALALAQQQADYTRRAGLGPWTQLDDEVQRLRVLNEMGHARQVLGEVVRLRDRATALPATSSLDESIVPWAVQERLLETARDVAERLGRHADALAWNAELVASRRGRKATASDIAGARYYDYFPLLRLGRSDEARQLLLECRQVFLDAQDIPSLGGVLGGLAAVEDARGHHDVAIRLEHDSLRYCYLARYVDGIATRYHNLGSHLLRDRQQPVLALAGHLASALIRALTSTDGTQTGIKAAAIDLREFGSAATPPADCAELCRLLGDIPDTDLSGLLAELSPYPEAAETALVDIVAQAQTLALPFWRRLGSRRRS